MKKLLTRALVVLFVVGGLVAILWPVPNWRLYDANWKPLAMTHVEAWCAGDVFGETQSNKPEPAKMAACIEAHPDLGTEPSVARATQWGCEAFELRTAYPTAECIRAFEGYELWWLLDGGYTWEWNDSHPRPQIVQSSIVNAPDRSGRDDESRDSMERMGE